MDKVRDEAIEECPVCPYCGFEIGTDDCTCGGLMNILPGNESRMDHLVFILEAERKS